MTYKTAQELYGRLEYLITRLNQRFDRKGTLQEVKEYVEEAFERGYTAESLCVDGLVDEHLFFKHGYTSHLSVVILACACCLESERVEEQGDPVEAANLFSKAIWYCQEADARDQAGYEDSAIVMRASKGGKARAQRYFGPAVEYLIRLLKDKCPEGGWGSASKTAKVLASDFTEFWGAQSLKDASAEVPDDPEGLIIRWLRKGGPAHDEFVCRKSRK